MHTIRLYDVDTLKPLDAPSIEAEFSAGQICHPMTQIHMRGDFLAVTCESARARQDRPEFTTRLIDWRTGQVVLKVVHKSGRKSHRADTVTHSARTIYQGASRLEFYLLELWLCWKPAEELLPYISSLTDLGAGSLRGNMQWFRPVAMSYHSSREIVSS